MVALTRNAGPKLLNEQQGGRFDHRAQCMHARCGIGAVDNAASHVDDRFIIRPGTTAPRLLPLQTSRRAGQALRDGSFQSTPVTRPESCDWQQWVGTGRSDFRLRCQTAVIAERFNPDGHPNSPTHGHLKFPHPDRASMRR